MAQLARWQESDLLALISSGEKESLILEYKACDALGPSDGKKNEVSKDVSAFANSAGGTIVYGMVENGHIPTNLDVGFLLTAISKEWLEQVINSRVQRRIDGIVIHEVELTTISPGRVAFVVSIPQSIRAPHQAHDKRFYKRFNFESVPMEEYEVRDTSRRGEAPDLSVRFNARLAGNTAAQGEEPHLFSIAISATITNESPVPAEYIVINIFVDKRLALSGPLSGLRATGERILILDGKNFDCNCLYMNHSVPGKMPIFQGANFSLLQQPFKVEVMEPNVYLLACELIAPGMGKRLSAALLSWDGSNPSLLHQ